MPLIVGLKIRFNVHPGAVARLVGSIPTVIFVGHVGQWQSSSLLSFFGKTQSHPMDLLPDELLWRVLKMLPAVEMYSAQRVSRRFRDLLEHDGGLVRFSLSTGVVFLGECVVGYLFDREGILHVWHLAGERVLSVNFHQKIEIMVKVRLSRRHVCDIIQLVGPRFLYTTMITRNGRRTTTYYTRDCPWLDDEENEIIPVLVNNFTRRPYPLPGTLEDKSKHVIQ